MSSIGKRVAMLREAHGLSKAELARRIGVKQPSLWEIENDKTKSLKGSTLAAICEVLHTTPDLILNGGGTEEGFELEMMKAELAHTVRALPAQRRQELVDFARFLLGKQGKSSAAPFGTAAVKPRRGMSVFGDLDEPVDIDLTARKK